MPRMKPPRYPASYNDVELAEGESVEVIPGHVEGLKLGGWELVEAPVQPDPVSIDVTEEGEDRP